MADYYPDMIARTMVVNPPGFFSCCWSVMRPFLPRDFVNSVCFGRAPVGPCQELTPLDLHPSSGHPGLHPRRSAWWRWPRPWKAVTGVAGGLSALRLSALAGGMVALHRERWHRVGCVVEERWGYANVRGRQMTDQVTQGLRRWSEGRLTASWPSPSSPAGAAESGSSLLPSSLLPSVLFPKPDRTSRSKPQRAPPSLATLPWRPAGPPWRTLSRHQLASR